jgi:hypothetical protein
LRAGVFPDIGAWSARVSIGRSGQQVGQQGRDMSNSLAEQLFQQLQGAPLQQLSQQLGTGHAETTNAVGAALPLLLGALGRNAEQPSGADALLGALQNDHSAGLDIGSVLGSVLGGGGQGGQILGHIFGGRQPRAEQGLGQVTGLGGDKAGMLLRLLAPIVMAYLAKRMFGQRQSAAIAGDGSQSASPQVLGDILGQEHQRVSQQGGAAGGLLGAVLDRDGDGDVDVSDLLKAGGSILGGAGRA